MKYLLLLAMVIVAVPFAFGLTPMTCIDSDGGPVQTEKPTPYISIVGSVEDKSGKKVDVCVNERGKEQASAREVKEFFCKNGLATSKTYKCREYGFLSCSNGACMQRASAGGKRCGNNIREAGELCDPPGAACVNAQGNAGRCSATCTSCTVTPRCGDGTRQGTEQCDPPNAPCRTAAGVQGTCNAACRCIRGVQRPQGPFGPSGPRGEPGDLFPHGPSGPQGVPARARCGDRFVDASEECDPPSHPCTKNGHEGICREDCSCYIRPETQRTPQDSPPPRTCDDLCTERGRTTEPVDHTATIFSMLQEYRCISGARVTTPGVLTIRHGTQECRCYAREPPRIEPDRTPPACQTACGPVRCDSSTSCPCPDSPNCMLRVSCNWVGWELERNVPVPKVEAHTEP